MKVSETSIEELRLVDQLIYSHFEASAYGFWNSFTKDGIVRFVALKNPFHKNTLKAGAFYKALKGLLGLERWQPLDNRIVDREIKQFLDDPHVKASNTGAEDYWESLTGTNVENPKAEPAMKKPAPTSLSVTSDYIFKMDKEGWTPKQYFNNSKLSHSERVFFYSNLKKLNDIY